MNDQQQRAADLIRHIAAAPDGTAAVAGILVHFWQQRIEERAAVVAYLRAHEFALCGHVVAAIERGAHATEGGP